MLSLWTEKGFAHKLLKRKTEPLSNKSEGEIQTIVCQIAFVFSQNWKA